MAANRLDGAGKSAESELCLILVAVVLDRDDFSPGKASANASGHDCFAASCGSDSFPLSGPGDASMRNDDCCDIRRGLRPDHLPSSHLRGLPDETTPDRPSHLLNRNGCLYDGIPQVASGRLRSWIVATLP